MQDGGWREMCRYVVLFTRARGVYFINQFTNFSCWSIQIVYNVGEVQIILKWNTRKYFKKDKQNAREMSWFKEWYKTWICVELEACDSHRWNPRLPCCCFESDSRFSWHTQFFFSEFDVKQSCRCQWYCPSNPHTLPACPKESRTRVRSSRTRVLRLKNRAETTLVVEDYIYHPARGKLAPQAKYSVWCPQ